MMIKNKYYLYLTEFFAGMAVMAVELGASRLLAPYFSSSQIVWTIIIGTIMIAMALGNLFGGKWADRDKDPVKLFRRILTASVWIALIPLLGKYVIIAITGILIVTISENLLVWAAFAAGLIIFVYPLFLLGTVTPSLIRFSVSDIDENGRVAGRLGACNTVGSIIGTFLPTFVTIPAVGTAITFLIFAAVLFALASLYLISVKKGRASVVISALIIMLSAVFGHRSDFAFWENDLTYEGESVYNYLQVKDDERATYLSTNVMFGVQSVMMKDSSLTGLYYDHALAAPVMAGLGRDSAGKNILILGMGTGTFATQCRKYFPDADIKGVEIDEKITMLAREYFDLSEDIPVTTYDGRAYLFADREKYDIIMVDAYQDITIPFQMSSTEFFTEVKDHLKEGGVMVVNMNMHGDDTEGDITDHLTDTVASVFKEVKTVDVPRTTNREMFASMEEGLSERLLRGADDLEDESLKVLMTDIEKRLVFEENGGRILTDDRAPVELLGMNTIDTLIQGSVGYYRDIFKEKGLKGLIEEL